MKYFYITLCLFCFHFSNGQQPSRRLEVLFLGDNGHHKPIERLPSLMAALGPKGINFTYTDDLADINLANLNKYDALMIYANWDEITPLAEKALLDYVASGKGFLPIHCASYCFRNSQEYVKLVGGQFWRHNMDSVATFKIQPNHPIMNGLADFTAYDETYLHSQLQPDNNILAVRDIKADQQKDKPNIKTEPYTWTRTHGKGKIFYTAYGHDEQTWSKKGFQELLYNAIIWSVNEEAQTAFKERKAIPFEYRPAKLPNYEKREGVQLQQMPLSPEESMKHIQLPVDFKLELFAAEPNVMHPIAMTWDEKGRLFVLITKDYPNERKAGGGSDYILLCEDTNGDGKADKFTKWADNLSIPTGLVFANGGLIVSQAPDMLFLKDTNGDDIADEKKTLFTGFGTFDTHAGPSNLHYGFDNWIWGCVGYAGYKGKFATSDSLNFGQAFFRFLPDGSKMEWMTTTSNNTWGMAFNETNDVFGSTANNSHGWYMPIPHACFNSKNRIDNGSRSTDTHRDMKPITEKVRQVDAFGGFTAAAGHNFYTARSFPKKYWNKIAFVAEPTGHVLHQNNLVQKGTDFYDKESFNLLAGADEWFSPVFAETGPDGAVWVADWYSYIIQHNPMPKDFKMGVGNAYETDLRDFTHGRIYRVSAKEAPIYQPISLSMSNPANLLKTLKNENMFWRMQAQRLLVERGKSDIAPQLIELIKDKSIDDMSYNLPAIHALWTLKGLNINDLAYINLGLEHPSAAVRKNAIKVMPFTEASVNAVLKYNLLNDKDPLVVLNALLLLSKCPINETVETTILNRMNQATEVDDRWLPDAFACVLTANNSKLLRKNLPNFAKNSPSPSQTGVAGHDHSKMFDEKVVDEKISDGIDLIITDIEINPKNPTARERISVTLMVKNKGKMDLPKDKFVPIDVNFEGMGLKVDQLSRNYKDGIKAGESVSITKNINGPWEGTLSFSTDFMGEYNLRATIDKNNEINESDKKNNTFSKKVTFTAPATLSAFAMERGLRSFASIANVDTLVNILRASEKYNIAAQSIIIKSIYEGWNYKIKGIKLPIESNMLLSKLGANLKNDKLDKLLVAWNVEDAKKPAADTKVIKIKSIKEAMKFDLSTFTVKAGQQVELTFENPDAMQHNLVIVKPKAMEKVGKAADKMMTDQKAIEKNYVPALPDVLFSTPLVNADQSFTLIFTAPTIPGNYPYLCTFPGHWSIMNGVMKVVK